ncbi:primosomal protein N' family DNA-binding protein, partial [Sphaerisporangium aureirubrum]
MNETSSSDDFSPEPVADGQTALEGVPAPGEGRGKAKGAFVAADVAPVARVVVDTPLPHLDRPFDYLVGAGMDADAVAGCRVRVRFAGKLTDGFLLERVESSEHEGALLGLERVVSPEAVLTPEIAALCRAVADRYAGTMSDVLRLAVPPRHARVEAEQASGGPARGGAALGGSASGGPASGVPATGESSSVESSSAVRAPAMPPSAMPPSAMPPSAMPPSAMPPSAMPPSA